MGQAAVTRIIEAQGGSREAYGDILADNEGLVWSVARRFFGRGVDPEDLFQLGCVGFIKAVNGYNPDFGTCFSTYAVPKIAGEIRRFLRDDGSVKVSRVIKERGAAIRKKRSELEQKLGREPSVSELSAELGMDPEDIAAAQTATLPPSSLDGWDDGGEEGDAFRRTPEETIGDGLQEDVILERIALRDALRALPAKEREIIALRYYRGMTQTETARRVGVSQVQVSRVERRAMKKLREMLD
jgi:RNA polymerase sporulation-specific sigma factor